jgi:NAD(P)H-dependent FMN reductase
MKIFAISGSLQAASSNRRILEVARTSGPDGVQVDIYDSLAEVPAFNPDLDVEPGPPVVVDLRARVGSADGVLIATPEYAYGMPGSLKNALDWLVSSGELYGRRVAILCGSPRPNGAANAREMLERTLNAQGAQVMYSATVQVVRGDPDNERRIAAAVSAAMKELVSDPRPAPSHRVH